MVGHGFVGFVFALFRFVFQLAVDADAFTEALGQRFFAVHVQQLVFKGRTAAVDYKNVHGILR
jgi:hypothetical protein